MRLSFYALGLISLVSACTSSSDFVAGQGSSTITVKNYKYQDVYNGVLKSIRSVDSNGTDIGNSLSVSRSDIKTGRIEANSPPNLFSYGEVVAVFIVPPKDSESYRIEVQSAPALATNVMANNWEEEVLQEIRKNLP